MNIIATILITAIISIGIQNYVPLKYFEYLNFNKQTFGTAVPTTINGSDTISGSRTTINTNFTNLYNGKMENATTSVASITTLSNLATVGTITSGTWNATALTVSKGGTGTTSPSLFRVILGDGALGLTIASSTGSTGQFLTSNGAGAYPSWQTSTVNQNDNYSWTGLHSFTGNINATGTSMFKNLNASSTAANPIYFNGIDYAMPSVEGASSTSLMTNGSGSLIWDSADWQELGEVITTSASSSISMQGFAARKDLKIIVYATGFSEAATLKFEFNDDAGGNYGQAIYLNYVYRSTALSTYGALDWDATTTPVWAEIAVLNNTSVKKQFNVDTISTASAQGDHYNIWGTWNNTTTQITKVKVYISSGTINAGSRITVYGKRN